MSLLGLTPPITCPPGVGGHAIKSAVAGQVHWIVRPILGHFTPI